MTVLPPVHKELTHICLDSDSWLTKTLTRAVMPPFTVREPVELEFLLCLSGFHSGSITILTCARTVEVYAPFTYTRPNGPADQFQFYDEVARRFVNALSCLEGVHHWISTDHDLDEAYFTIEKTRLEQIYDALGLKTSYPFHNLVSRLASTYQLVRAHLDPYFQSTFLADFPIEILYHIISFIADEDVPAFANSCMGLRMLCGHDKRLHKRLYFRMRYDMQSLHTTFPPLQEDLYLEIIDHMQLARRRVTSAIRSLVNGTVYSDNIRFISFDNEWDHMWPTHVSRYLLLPPATDTQIFEPLYNTIVTIIAHLPVQHVRFVSLVISRRLLDHVARHPYISRVTIERYSNSPSLLEVPSLAPKATNVTFLAIGFHGDQYSHRSQWRLISMFPALRHLYAFNCDVSDVSIRYPIMYGGMFHIHALETFHVQGSSRYIDSLTRWLSLASADAKDVPGRLQRFKLQARKSIPHEDAHHLVSTLAACHPNIRILVLEGLDNVYPDFFEFIARSFRKLEGLSIVRYSTGSLSSSTVCDWNSSIYKYAEKLHAAESLQHLEINTLWPSPILSPRLLHVLFTALHNRVPLVTEKTWQRAAGDGPGDATCIALPFATHCPSLETFAIRCGTCYFSCRIVRNLNNIPTFADVRSVLRHVRFESWNPEPGATWDFKA